MRGFSRVNRRIERKSPNYRITFLKISDLEWNNKTCRFWETSQNDNEFQG